MKRPILISLLIIYHCSAFTSLAQNKKVDSLFVVLKTAKEDTTKVNVLNGLAVELGRKNPDTAIYYASKAEALAIKLNYMWGHIVALDNKSFTQSMKGDNKNAIKTANEAMALIEEFMNGEKGKIKTKYLVEKGKIYADLGAANKGLGNYAAAINAELQALALYKEAKDKRSIAAISHNLAMVYKLTGNLGEALKLFYAALKTNEERGNKLWQSYNLCGIGMINEDMGKLDEAQKNYFAALKLEKELGDNESPAALYHNIGKIYSRQKQYKEALENYNLALEINTRTGNKEWMSMNLSGIGSVNQRTGNYKEALSSYFKALRLAEESGNRDNVANFYRNIGQAYFVQKKLKEASEYFNKSLEITKEIGDFPSLQDIYDSLGDLDTAKGDYKSALKNYTLARAYGDSIYNKENEKKIVQTQMQYDFDKKQAADSIKASEEKKVINAELKQEQTKGYALYGGLALLVVFGGFMFNRLKVTRRQKNIIEKQKDIVEDKNREITQSIEYALRIQSAILPSQRLVKQYLENSFVLYKPKDIVAGDFYWMEGVQFENENQFENLKMKESTTNFQIDKFSNFQIILFAACDCTGHGVPGAMVSVVCHNALNRAVREFGLTKPSEILDKTAEIVIENFSKSDEDIKDGMDISLCAFNTGTKTLEWAGANNPLWIIKNDELTEIKADKQPIGIHENNKPFTNHQMKLNSGDSIYLFTDGFADQFGGEKGAKKLTRKRFKDLIVSVQNKTMNEQGNELDKFITEYRKDVEQIDDILVIGVGV